MSALFKTVKQLLLLKPQHDACFLINPTVSYPTIRGMKHTPTSTTPHPRAGAPVSCQRCWPKHLTQAGPRDCPLSKLTQQKQQVHVCGGGTEPGQFPLWPCTSSGRHRRRQCQLRPLSKAVAQARSKRVIENNLACRSAFPVTWLCF